MTVGSGAPPPEPDTDDELPRVVLMVNRHLEVRGFVEYEDDNVIVVRSVHNEVESFPKARLLQVVRLVKPRPGQQGVVVLRNGQVRRGVILEDTFEHVLIEIEGIRAKLVREAVDHVELEPTFDERYAALKASLKPQMERQHLALCRWLLEEHRYDLAQVELRELLWVEAFVASHACKNSRPALAGKGCCRADSWYALADSATLAALRQAPW